MTIKASNSTKKCVLKYLEVIELSKFLEGVYNPLAGRYNEGWNDQRVAESVPFELGVGNVQSLRREMFGELHLKTKDPDIQEDIESLFTSLGALSTRLQVVEQKLTKLCSELGVTD